MLRPGGRAGVNEASVWATGLIVVLGCWFTTTADVDCSDPGVNVTPEAAAEAAAEVAPPKGSLPSDLIFWMAARR